MSFQTNIDTRTLPETQQQLLNEILNSLSMPGPYVFPAYIGLPPYQETKNDLLYQILMLLTAGGGGGGGGTVDHTTVAHLPFKSTAGSFENSNLRYSIEPISDVSQFELKQGAGPVMMQMHYQPTALIRKIVFGNIGPVVSPFDTQKFLLNFQDNVTQLIQDILLINDESISKAMLKIVDSYGTIEAGDINNLGNGNVLKLDDTNDLFSLGNANMKLQGEKNNRVLRLGDTTNANNQTRIDLDDIKQLIDITTGVNATGKIRLDGVNGDVIVGDIDELGSIQKIKISNIEGKISFMSGQMDGEGRYNFKNVPNFANQASAEAGGLVNGDIFKTKIGDETFLKIVLV